MDDIKLIIEVEKCIKPLGTCRGWGSSLPVALLSTPPETRRAAHLNVFLGGEVLFCGASRHQWCGGFSPFFSWAAGRCPPPVRKAGRWRGPGTAVGGSDSGRVSGPSRGSPQLRRPLGEPSVRMGGPLRRCASAGA
ncbi:unnamed protein product [Pleuronectes platessa]|uniref:Uncharacterized protein n=1 Tax=Pleuronectes platessa TaxID=8262 RepID=A0A9N7ZFY9_PLEPL|nr:unnamed protein product [Pleuronectes platessa]